MFTCIDCGREFNDNERAVFDVKRCGECKRAWDRQYYQDNKDRILKGRGQNYYKNRDKHLKFNKTEARKIIVDRYRAKNKQSIRLKSRQKRLDIKQEVLAHYSNDKVCCVVCGDTGIKHLQLDHINNGGNKQRKELNSRGGWGFYSWLLKNNLPEGFQVLCANCNIDKEYDRREEEFMNNSK